MIYIDDVHKINNAFFYSNPLLYHFVHLAYTSLRKHTKETMYQKDVSLQKTIKYDKIKQIYTYISCWFFIKRKFLIAGYVKFQFGRNKSESTNPSWYFYPEGRSVDVSGFRLLIHEHVAVIESRKSRRVDINSGQESDPAFEWAN